MDGSAVKEIAASFCPVAYLSADGSLSPRDGARRRIPAAQPAIRAFTLAG